MNHQALIIGASSESLYAISVAQKRGYTVTAFDGNPDAPGLTYADNAYVTDIKNPQNIINKINFKPDFILPVPIGRYLISSGAINDHFGLKGISQCVANICTDKYLFHSVLSKNSLRFGVCHLIEAGCDKSDIGINSYKLPFILKPRYGSGSRNVYIVNSISQWNDLQNSIFPSSEDYIIESVFEGDEYGVDGAVFNGKLHITLLRKKILTQPPFRQCVGYFSLPTDQYSKLYDYAAKHLQNIALIIGMDNCLFHCDFIWNGSGMDIIEISPRPSGHNLHNLFTPLATGVSMIDAYIDCMENKNSYICPKHISNMLIGYFDFENCFINHIPTKEEFPVKLKESIIEYQCLMKSGYIKTAENGHALMKRGFYIIKGNSFRDLIQKRNLLKSFFT